MHRLSLMICAAVMATASPVLAQPADAPVLDADAGAALNQLGASLRRLKTWPQPGISAGHTLSGADAGSHAG
jgi:hypothetical protein